MDNKDISHPTEEGRRYGQEHAFQLINQMPFPVEVCDVKRMTTLVNAVFLDTFEVPPMGRIVSQLQRCGCSEVFDEILAGKKSAVVELMVEPGDLAPTYGAHKGPAWFETMLYPLLSPHGEILRVVAVWRDVTDRRQSEARIKSSLQEKDLLLKEVHHRVKNNLQVISSLLSLQGDSLKEPGLRRHFEDARDRVRSMASIHEMLYASTDLARIDFSDYIHMLASQLFCSHNISANRIELAINVEPVSLGINLGVPCGLLINELVTNALRHAFPGDRTGSIVVSMKEMPDHSVRLSVCDNGVGLPAEIDVENAPSLGFQLVTTLVGQLNGTLEVRRSEGTEFIILF